MIHSPVLIIGCARSGTTLLYNVLSEVSSLWSIGYESKAIIERYHSPEVKGWDSGALSAGDLTTESRAFIHRRFTDLSASGDYWRRVNELRRILNGNPAYKAFKNRGRGDAPGAALGSVVPGAGLAFFRRVVEWRNRALPANRSIRLLEKTPENCLRLPFLASLFPDGRVIYLVRDGRANVHSLVEGWRQPHLFPGYQTPLPVTSPGQSRGRWAFTLIPGWRDLVNSPLEVISAHQWATSNQAVLDYIRQPDSLPVLTVRYEELLLDASATLTRIAPFLQLAPEEIPAIGMPLPEVNVVTAPNLEKWRRDEHAIKQIIPIIEPMMKELGYFGW